MKILTYEVDSRKKLGICNKEETWIYPIESFDSFAKPYGRKRSL